MILCAPFRKAERRSWLSWMCLIKIPELTLDPLSTGYKRYVTRHMKPAADMWSWKNWKIFTCKTVLLLTVPTSCSICRSIWFCHYCNLAVIASSIVKMCSKVSFLMRSLNSWALISRSFTLQAITWWPFPFIFLMYNTCHRLPWYFQRCCHHPFWYRFSVETERITFMMTTGIVPFEVSASSLLGSFAQHSNLLLDVFHHYTHCTSRIRPVFLQKLSVNHGARIPSKQDAKIVLFTSFDISRIAKKLS